MLFKRILFLTLALLASPAMAQFTDQQKQTLHFPQVLANGGLENGLAGWSKSGSSTLTQNTTAANVAFGKGSAAWTPANNGETLTAAAVSVPPGLYGGDCLAAVYLKGGGTTLTLQVVDGVPAVVASTPVATETTFKRYEVRFTCPSSGSIGLRLQASAATSVVYVDQATISGTPRAVQENATPNYVANGNAEENFVPAGWSTYNDTALAAPVDGTGGTASNITAVSRYVTSTNLIDGKASFLLAKSAANAQGQGWSYSFTLPARSPLLNSFNDLTFDYSMDVTTADLVRVYLYDVTNSTLITPQFTSCGGGSTPSLSSVVTCHAELGWLASTTGTSYRLLFHVAGTSAVASNLYVDNLFVGQHSSQSGPQMTPWTSYTPTTQGIGTPTIGYAEWRRNGENVELRGYITIGTPTAVTLKVGLPSGLNGRTGGINIICQGVAGTDYTGNALSSFTPLILDADKTALSFGYGNSRSVFNPIVGNGAMGAGNVLVYHASCPVTEFTGTNVGGLGENKCDYAYNTTTWNTADAFTYGYGPQGAAITGALTTDKVYAVQLRRPIQATDDLALEFAASASGPWSRVGQFSDGVAGGVVPYDNGTTSSVDAGAVLRPSSSTIVSVQFGRYAQYAGYSTAATAINWQNGWRWRVKQCSAGIVTSFGVAPTDGSVPGLVKNYLLTAQSVVPTAAGGGSLSGATVAYDITRTGYSCTINGLFSSGTVTGTVSSVNFAVPSWATGRTYTSMFSDAYTGTTYMRASMSPGSPTLISLAMINSTTFSTGATLAFTLNWVCP